MVVAVLAALAGTGLGLSPGDLLPELPAVQTQDGKTVDWAALRGRTTLLYFYPKDDTPGCTKQACALRDGFAEFKRRGIVVYGVSTQDADSHREFRAKHRLPFDLIVDVGGKLGSALGVDRMPLLGLFKRQSVLIGPDRRVLAVLRDVDPSTHAGEILGKVPNVGR